MKADKKQALFKEFLSSGNVMIVDKSSASRRRLMKTLVDMGAKRSQIDSVSHYSEAIDVIKEKKPKLILSDFTLNGGSGFDLFKEYRIIHPEEKKAVLILITSNISQSAVAKAAEEDVDSFIIKPYTVKSLEKSLITTVIGKIHPNKYIQAIEKGKEAMFKGKYDVALELFDEATSLSKKPSLALFYHGQTKYMMEIMDEAQDDYKKGLEINNIHFKCQIGLYEIFMKDEKYVEAYSIVKNIAKYFPANPDRLKEVIRLAIRTENYADMEDYYNIFVELDERTEDVVTYVSSGMYVSGKYFMLEGDSSKCREIFDKVGISCSGKSKFLGAMIKLLSEYEHHDDAQKLIARFGSKPDDEAIFKISNFLAYTNTLSSTEKVSQGLELWNNGIKDPESMKITIQALRDEGSDKKADEYLEEANHQWPTIFSINTKQAA